MAARYRPHGVLTVGGIPAYDMYLAAPPVAWHVPVELIREESNSSIDEGKYHPERGEARGNPQLDRTSETYLTGTGGRSGVAFDDISGTWNSNWKHPRENVYGVYQPDTSASATVHELVSDVAFAAFPECEILLHRGQPGVSATAANYSADNCYTYITFQYENQHQWRLNFAYSRPVTLQFSENSGSTWKNVAMASDAAYLQSFLEGKKDLLITIRVHVDRVKGHLTISFPGVDRPLVHSPGKDLIGAFSEPGKMRLQSRNGFVGFNLFPVTYGSVTISKSARNFGRNIPNAGRARVVLNSLTAPHPDQVDDYTVQTDGRAISFNATASIPTDTSEAPLISDACLILPAIWTQEVDGLPDFRTATLPVVSVTEVETYNQFTRQKKFSATVTVENRHGFFNDLVGNLAINLVASNGIYTAQRCRGVALNPSFYRTDRFGYMRLNVYDKMAVMDVDLDQEVAFDGWCIFSAVRYLCEASNIHPYYLQRIPLYIPPGADADAPYGPAGYDCPYYVLGRGTGLNGKYVYYNNNNILSILQELCADSSDIDPFTQLPTGYMMGFFQDGGFDFGPVSYFDRLPVITYSDIDPSGIGSITGGIEWSYSTDQMRTHLDLQTIDDITYELIHYHVEMGANVRRMKGYRHGHSDRSARYGNEDALIRAGDAMSIPASIPELVGKFRAPFWPHIHAGDIVAVMDFKRGYILAVIEEMVSEYSAGAQQACYSDLTVRALFNYL